MDGSVEHGTPNDRHPVPSQGESYFPQNSLMAQKANTNLIISFCIYAMMNQQGYTQ